MKDATGYASFAVRMRASGFDAERVMAAVEEARRDRYVAPDDRPRAHSADMLPLPCGQATERLDDAVRMVAALDIDHRHRVLEIGTGSGFLTDVLAQLAGRVVTVERYRSLLSDARERHADRALATVTYHQQDAGALPDLGGPFDRVISTVAFAQPPKQFVDHLVAEGVMVAPIGPPEGPQTVMRLGKIGARFERENLFQGWFTPIETGVALAL